MPTDEERREVAENLRNMCSRGCRYAEEFYELLNETVMHEWDFHSFYDVADRLADLIEPEERTCRDDGVGVFRCTRCGAFVKRGAVMDCTGVIPLRFCPNCGAKVVEE